MIPKSMVHTILRVGMVNQTFLLEKLKLENFLDGLLAATKLQEQLPERVAGLGGDGNINMFNQNEEVLRHSFSLFAHQCYSSMLSTTRNLGVIEITNITNLI